MKPLLKKSLSVGAGPAGLIATGVGFFCDFVKPYLNLVPYLLAVSAIISLAFWFFFLRNKIKGEFDLETLFSSLVGKIFGFAVLSTLFWLIMLPIFAFSPERGIAATQIPALSDWQERLFGKLDQIDSKLDLVLEKIDALDQGKGGLIAKPSTPNEWYHNARLHELGGNLLEARKAYEPYFTSNLSYLDPFLSYQLILKNLEGPSSARELMGKLRDQHPSNPSAHLAVALSKDEKTDRIFLLTKLISEFPSYGPGFLYLAKQYSFAEAGLQTNQERRSERDALEAALALEKTEQVSKFFIDKKAADELLTWAKSELKTMDGYLGSMIDASLKISATTNNKVTTITFTPTELVKKIYYRLHKQGEFKDTGTSGVTMPGSTESLPNYYVMESFGVGDHVVEAKYIDTKGSESPVIEETVHVKALSIQTAPFRMIDPQTGDVQYMVLWSPYEEKEYTYRYSVDSQALDQTAPEYLSGVYLKGLKPGKHTLYVQGSADNLKTNIEQVDFEVQ